MPEAPASVNCHLTIAGRQGQLTLRDSDEGRLLERLVVVLARFPLEASPTVAARPAGWCAKISFNGRSWYSHKTADGHWCKGR